MRFSTIPFPETKGETEMGAAVNDGRLPDLLAGLGLSSSRNLDENESFLILRCEDASGADLVLKYLHNDSVDGRRRLNNEALVLKTRGGGETRPRLLRYRDHGPRYLLTEFDSGELLRPHRLREPAVLIATADALAAFQAIPVQTLDEGIVDRERSETYYRKVLAKHLLHLVPGYLSLGDAAASWRIVQKSLPAISKRRTICHGDFLPTNLLYHPEDRTITVTDLEGFMRSNHPLFDVVALFTTDEGPIAEWSWQSQFLERYLASGGRSYCGDPASEELRRVYRGILTFFLVYRLNEARLHVENKEYFDGLGKAAFLRRRVLGWPWELLGRRGRGELEPSLETRRQNLRQVLQVEGYGQHWRRLTSLSGAGIAKRKDILGSSERETHPEPAKP